MKVTEKINPRVLQYFSRMKVTIHQCNDIEDSELCFSFTAAPLIQILRKCVLVHRAMLEKYNMYACM